MDYDRAGVSVVLSGSSLSVDEGNVGITTLPLCVQLQNIMTGLDRSVLLLLSTIFGTAGNAYTGLAYLCAWCMAGDSTAFLL